MKVLLMLLAIAAGGFGALMFSISKSAIHEIEALILFLICAVLFSGSAIVDAINSSKPKPNL